MVHNILYTACIMFMVCQWHLYVIRNKDMETTGTFLALGSMIFELTLIVCLVILIWR